MTTGNALNIVKTIIGNFLVQFDATLTFESSCCVLSSSSFLLLLRVFWMSPSLFTDRGSLSDAVVPAAGLRSGGEELRDV